MSPKEGVEYELQKWKDLRYWPEPPGICELCGKTEELRPYGPGGKNVCFECAMKNEDEAKLRFDSIAFGPEGKS